MAFGEDEEQLEYPSKRSALGITPTTSAANVFRLASEWVRISNLVSIKISTDMRYETHQAADSSSPIPKPTARIDSRIAMSEPECRLTVSVRICDPRLKILGFEHLFDRMQSQR